MILIWHHVTKTCATDPQGSQMYQQRMFIMIHQASKTWWYFIVQKYSISDETTARISNANPGQVFNRWLPIKHHLIDHTLAHFLRPMWLMVLCNSIVWSRKKWCTLQELLKSGRTANHHHLHLLSTPAHTCSYYCIVQKLSILETKATTLLTWISSDHRK